MTGKGLVFQNVLFAAPPTTLLVRIQHGPPESGYELVVGKYRLADVQGNQTAKERSWKTGFITKKPKPIEVVGASSLNLKDHVGRKISVVGVKDGDTHLKARTAGLLRTLSEKEQHAWNAAWEVHTKRFAHQIADWFPSFIA